MYETAHDLEQERFLQRQIEHIWNCELKKMPVHYELDFIALRNSQPVAVVEVKTRTTPFAQYPDYMISLSKFLKAWQYARSLLIEPLLVVQFSDVTAYTRLIKADSMTVDIKGRQGRNHEEPVVHIPLSLFKCLSIQSKE